MKKFLFVLFALLLASCSTPQQIQPAQVLPTPQPTRDMSLIKTDEQHIDFVSPVGYFARYEGYNMFRIYDSEAGVICWFIYSSPDTPTKRDIGLGCLPVESTRLFQ